MKMKRITIVRRGLPAPEAAGKNGPAEATVNRRIMVTVERETVTVLVRGQPKDNDQKPASEKAGLESQHLELLPPAPAREGRDRK
jgi:hypothetical protein